MKSGGSAGPLPILSPLYCILLPPPWLFEAYITNLGKYNEGELVGETLKFPTTTEEVQALLKRIGVDGVRYEEFFITSFDGDVLGLYDYLTEYENLDELNHLACLLSELDQGELEKMCIRDRLLVGPLFGTHRCDRI